MKLEKMGEFFNSRLDGYDAHMLNNVCGATEFYRFTASLLPMSNDCRVIDLGCGTGLELAEYFLCNPHASVTGIDLTDSMLQKLRSKFPDKRLTLINGSYFDIPFGEDVFDAAVSVESLHHFTQAQKIPLYSKLVSSLKKDGYFILTDYMVESGEEEALNFSELARIKKEQAISDDDFYHYDTPLTIEHETEALLAGGFSKVAFSKKWQNTVVLKASK